MSLVDKVANVKDILQDVQCKNKHEDTNEADDRHVGKGSRHDLTSSQTNSSDLAVATRVPAARARTTIVTEQRLTDTVILTGDIRTVILHCLAARARPSFDAFASKAARRRIETGP